jgi:PEP-CTERM motif-containing protein
MNTSRNRWIALLAILVGGSILSTQSSADPLAGEIPKFSQQPMINTTLGGQIYFGHDEFSTAYGVGTAANPPASYRGTFMADDFADKFSTPVVHLTWWGSYMNNTTPTPQPPVQKFLIAFETDVPAQPGSFSHPGQVLQYEVVTAGPLTPGSGTFTETLQRGPDPVLGEALYRYNAELKLPFSQQPDTVYWLKIAALVDSPTPIVQPIPPGVTQWGWHNRDYTINDPLASTFPAVNPGEFIDGTIPGTNLPIWHFQDDAVQGNLDFIVNPPIGTPPINQTQMVPTHYQFVNSAGVGPIDGPAGIEIHSKDLAFRLFTVVPEPATCLLMGIALAGVFATRRLSRVA